MGRVLLRVLQIALTAVGGLLVVPIAVNVGTSGDAPDWLRPYVDWLWPVAIVCVLLVIALEVWDKVRVPKGTISGRRPHDPRNADLALAQVAKYVDERLRGSLAEQVRLALSLDERPAAVRQPGHLVQRVSGEEFQIAPDLGIAEIFEQLNESMLLLGAPGAGKTTLLLDLAAELVRRGRTIPVVVDLAEWSRSGQLQFALLGGGDRGPRDFVEWLLTSVWDRYRIPQEIGRVWLEENRFTFLLDGLDEVRDADRERCVLEINNLQSKWGVTRLAVCSRETEYGRLAARLRLQGAVVIRPLTEDQVNEYFATVSPRLAEVLAVDGELWELLTTPLMLNIMTLAQGNRTWQELSEYDDPAVRRRLVFDAYVVEVLARRRSGERSTPERMLRAIRMLAVASNRMDSGAGVVQLDDRAVERVFDEPIDNIRNFWMAPASIAVGQMVATVALSIQFSAAAGIAAISLSALFAWALFVYTAPRPVAIGNWGTLAGYLIAVAVGMTALVLALVAVASLAAGWPTPLVAAAAFLLALAEAGLMLWLWSVYLRRGFPQGWRALLVVVVVAGAATAGAGLLFGISSSVLHGWAVGVAQGILLMILLIFIDLMQKQPSPDPGGSRITVGLVSAYAIAAVGAALAVASSWASPFWLPMLGWLVGVAYAFLIGGFLGTVLVGRLCWVAIAITGELVPWRRAFLRFAVDRSLLTVSDGEYRFIHLLVRDHLAGCDPARLAGAIRRRRGELTAPVSESSRA